MRRGDVVLVDFPFSTGGGAKVRPALVIQNDRIVGVGKSNEFPPNPGDDVIDGRGKLALPGIFDTHVHNAQQLGRSCGDEAYSGPERLFRRLWPVEAHTDKGDALCAGTACLRGHRP